MSDMIMIERFKLFEVVQSAIEAVLPSVVTQVMEIKSKLDDAPDYLTTPRAARLAGVSPTLMYKYINNGRIKTKYFANSDKKMIPKTELKKLFTDRIDVTSLSLNGHEANTV